MLLVLAIPAQSRAVVPDRDQVVASAAGSVARAAGTHRVKPTATLVTVGSRYVSAPIPIRGRTAHLGSGRYRLVVQRRMGGQPMWLNRDQQYVISGGYRFSPQHVATQGEVAFRTVLYHRGNRVATSNVVRVRVVPRSSSATCASAPSPTTCPQPASTVEQRTVETANCPQLTVDTHQEERTIGWRWSASDLAWVPAPSPWVTVPGSEGQRAAGLADCVKVVDGIPAGATLPDLRIKDLTKCGAGDLAATNGTCFKIDPAAPYSADFPSLEGRKLLKFGVITINVGAGPSEIVADRSAADATDWTAYQNYYGADGTLLGSVLDPGVGFFYAGDGHHHWHIRDFDDYQLLDAGGTVVARAEKHGYCIQDNTTYTPMQGQPGVPEAPVYGEDTSCGKGLTSALTVVHGLSRGWGDTYPTTLPNQAIDITGLPDGTYTVRVHADALGAVAESDDANNTAEVKVQITGDTVTVVPDTSTGGLP
ncbi:lysyl oxidase family protein [Nocardioides rubriscoriae]|uniref:lysyl oxidase family protein n=1 Tax=Nocardioides rubriscoriae TaxID=642762 RepID=UPI0011DF7D28|nr:lysyl oxidase family protein [Nocardioides rubriscoriae]